MNVDDRRKLASEIDALLTYSPRHLNLSIEEKLERAEMALAEAVAHYHKFLAVRKAA